MRIVVENKPYFRSEQWYKDADSAKVHWRVTREQTVSNDLTACKIVFVEAESDTGSRYCVVATSLSPAARASLGGPVLVSVIQPWQDCWALQESGTLHDSYVAEHLSGHRWQEQRLHGGDLTALTMTVAYALGREARED